MFFSFFFRQDLCKTALRAKKHKIPVRGVSFGDCVCYTKAN